MCNECYGKGTSPKQQVLIPQEYIYMFPNDAELGGAVRRFYNEHYK
jgi:hypothetical protein